jgi:hypothetical protein
MRCTTQANKRTGQQPMPNVDSHSGVPLQYYKYYRMAEIKYDILVGVGRAIDALPPLCWDRSYSLALERVTQSIYIDGLQGLDEACWLVANKHLKFAPPRQHGFASAPLLPLKGRLRSRTGMNMSSAPTLPRASHHCIIVARCTPSVALFGSRPCARIAHNRTKQKPGAPPQRS